MKNNEDNGMAEFLRQVTEQIRWRKAQKPVEIELREHIIDQSEAFESEGMDGKEAMAASIKDMGNPVEIGRELDKIHRPRMSWALFAMVILAGIIGVALQIAILSVSMSDVELAGSGRFIYASKQVSYYLSVRQIKFFILSVAAMLIVRQFDYRMINKHIKKIAVIFSAAWVLLILFAPWRNVLDTWISYGRSSLLMLILFSIPLYALLLYAHKGEGYGGLIKCILWGVLFMAFARFIPSLSTVFVIASAQLILLSMVILNNWFNVSKKLVLGIIVGIIGAVVAFWLLLVYSDGVADIFLAEYQQARIQAFYGLSKDISGADFMADNAREVLNNSSFWSGDTQNLQYALKSIDGIRNDYTFVGIAASFGVIAEILVVVLLFAISVLTIKLSVSQKNTLGKILGSGCGIVFLLETLMSLLLASGMIPSTSAFVPFISSGGSQMVTMYVMIGIVLSIKRYSDVATYDGDSKKVMKKTFDIAGYKFIVEK